MASELSFRRTTPVSVGWGGTLLVDLKREVWEEEGGRVSPAALPFLAPAKRQLDDDPTFAKKPGRPFDEMW